MRFMFWSEFADIRRWVGNEPPSNLHARGIIEGKLIEPWNYPITVEYDPNEPAEPVRRVVTKQGLDGTTSKHASTGECGRLAPDGSTTIIDFHGEPMAGDPVSQNLRAIDHRQDPGL